MRQRGEQNGSVGSWAGLPQIGHFFGLPPGPAPPVGSAGGIEPTEADRKTLAAEQRDRFIERQSDHVGIGADHLDHERSRNALDRKSVV